MTEGRNQLPQKPVFRPTSGAHSPDSAQDTKRRKRPLLMGRPSALEHCDEQVHLPRHLVFSGSPKLLGLPSEKRKMLVHAPLGAWPIPPNAVGSVGFGIVDAVRTGG